MILLHADRAETLPRPVRQTSCGRPCCAWPRRRTCATRRWVTEQYDRYVLGNTVLAQPEDAGVIRIDEASGLGVAMSVDGNGRFARLDPYTGAKLALAEAYRNVAVTGATPIAVTNCLNFGSPEDPGVMWQFAEAVRGLADGCPELGIPVTGGNVSFYNSTGATPIHPTPVVGVLGRAARRADRGCRWASATPATRCSCSATTREELSGSEWAHVVHEHLGGVAAGGGPGRRAAPGRRARRGGPGRAPQLGPRPVRRRAGPGAGRGVPAARVRRPDRSARGPDARSSSCSANPPAGCWCRVQRGQEVAFAALAAERGRAVRGAGDGAGAVVALAVDGLFEIPLDELREAYTGDPAGAVRLTGSRP